MSLNEFVVGLLDKVLLGKLLVVCYIHSIILMMLESLLLDPIRACIVDNRHYGVCKWRMPWFSFAPLSFVVPCSVTIGALLPYF
jgi:hypothetical protein